VCVWGRCVDAGYLETQTKQTFNRSVGLAASTCPNGTSNFAGVCLSQCQSGYTPIGALCSKNCPTGYLDLGASCQKIYPKSTYVRGATPNFTSTNTGSFTRNININASDDVFTIAVMSDPQLPWDETSDEVKASGGIAKLNTDSLWKNSRRYNLEMAQSINLLSDISNQTASKFAFTVINGDLTSYFHPEQHSEFRAIYDAGFPWAYPNALKTPVYLGLGNHDYENNVNSCSSNTFDNNRCTKNAINLIRGAIFNGYFKNMPSMNIESYDAGSLAYSWNKGPYHFVQLHNHPDYEIPSLGISKSIEWLKQDLARATQRGQVIILNFHNPTELTGLSSILSGHQVAAIFAGHLHAENGRISSSLPNQTPIFLSGSADQHTYLRVDFKNTAGQRSIRIATIDTTAGAATEKSGATVIQVSP